MQTHPHSADAAPLAAAWVFMAGLGAGQILPAQWVTPVLAAALLLGLGAALWLQRRRQRRAATAAEAELCAARRRSALLAGAKDAEAVASIRCAATLRASALQASEDPSQTEEG